MSNTERAADLEEDLAKMRKQLSCLICTELLFQPMALTGCGHVFCYGCSYDWMKGSMTCPTCRAKVKTRPVPIYLIKELVDTLMTRIELQSPLEEGATFRQHQEEQRDLFESHRDELYPELFPRGTVVRGRLPDHEDRVMRCINCHWEIDGTICAGCGQDYGSAESDDDYNTGEAVGYDEDEQYASFSELEDEEPNEYDHDDSFIDNRPSSQIHITTQEDDGLSDESLSSQDYMSNAEEGLVDRTGVIMIDPDDNEGSEDEEFDGFSDEDREDDEEEEDPNRQFTRIIDGESDDGEHDDVGGNFRRAFEESDDEADSDLGTQLTAHEEGLRDSSIWAQDALDDEEMYDDEDDDDEGGQESGASQAEGYTHRPRRIIYDSDDD